MNPELVKRYSGAVPRYVRAIAACFDSYLGAGDAGHSAGV
jgi:hypothetical protein